MALIIMIAAGQRCGKIRTTKVRTGGMLDSRIHMLPLRVQHPLRHRPPTLQAANFPAQLSVLPGDSLQKRNHTKSTQFPDGPFFQDIPSAFYKLAMDQQCGEHSLRPGYQAGRQFSSSSPLQRRGPIVVNQQGTLSDSLSRVVAMNMAPRRGSTAGHPDLRKTTQARFRSQADQGPKPATCTASARGNHTQAEGKPGIKRYTSLY